MSACMQGVMAEVRLPTVQVRMPCRRSLPLPMCITASARRCDFASVASHRRHTEKTQRCSAACSGGLRI